MLFAGTSSLTITFDCSKIYEALMKACRPQLEEAYRNVRDESTAGIIERMLNAIDNNRAQGSQRLPQSDLKSIALHASMPVPPTMNWKGGQLYAQWIGV